MITITVLIAALVAVGVCGVSTRHVGWSITSAVVAGLLQFMYSSLGFPTFGFFYLGLWWMLIGATLVGGASAFFAHMFAVNARVTSYLLSVSPISAVLCMLIVVWIFSSCAMFHSNEYRNNIGEVEVRTFTEDVPIIDTKKVRLVPKETALTLAKKVLGQARDGKILGSQLKIDSNSAAIQEVQGEMYWIFPLDFGGLWKWNNLKSVPGYIRVSAHDPAREAQLIDSNPISGEKFNLRYTKHAYFGSRLARRLWWEFPTIGREDFTFEVDDEWNPYYVVSLTHPTIGFAGRQTKGVVVVDPQTGSATLYEGSNIPTWIDRVKPLSQALTQVNYWGTYVDGWVNANFGKHGLQIATTYQSGSDMWFVNLGGERNFWYTGMTSPNSTDQSLVGMMFVDTRGGGAIYYTMDGGSDENGIVEAVDSNLGADSARWQPSQPIPYNIQGVPTYVVPIISTEGIFVEIALVHANNINILARGKTLNTALSRYRTRLTQSGNEIAPSSASTLKGIGPVIVTRIGDTVIDGNKNFYVMVEGQNDKMFSSTGEVDQTLLVALVKIGDMVTIEFIDTDEPIVPIERLEVEGIDLRVSEVQSAFNVQREISRESEEGIEETRDAQEFFENLSPEEQRQLIKEAQEKQKGGQ